MYMTWNTVQNGQFTHPFENKDIILQVDVVSNLAYEFCSYFGISVNQILSKYGHLMQWQCDFFGVSKECAYPLPNEIRVFGTVTLWFFILGVSNN